MKRHTIQKPKRLVNTGEIFQVILAAPEDVPYLGAIERAAATVFSGEDLPAALRNDAVPQGVLLQAVAQQSLFVARAQCGNVVGYALLRFFPSFALLAQIDVLPEYARRGIGRRLVTAVVEKARMNNAPTLYLTTFSHIPWNAPFYASAGFTPCAEKSLPHELRDILQSERALGLRNRIAMCLKLKDKK